MSGAFRTRRIGAAILLSVAVALGGGWVSRYEFSLRMVPANPSNHLPAEEIAAVLLLSVLVALTSARMWWVERTALRRGRRAVSTVLALAVTAGGPQVVLAASRFGSMTSTQWSHAAADLSALSGLALGGATVLGSQAASGLVLLSYFGCSALVQIEPALRVVSPVSASFEPGAHWAAAAALVVGGCAASIWTLGQSARVGRRLA